MKPETYAHLRDLAGRIHSERGGGPTLQPTGLLHEAWLKISKSSAEYNDRGHFLAVAARAMRQILVDRARARGTDKRGAGRQQQSLSRVPAITPEPVNLIALDALLDELEELDARAAEVVQLRVFGGLTALETAAAMGISKGTANRSWRVGRIFLAEALSRT